MAFPFLSKTPKLCERRVSWFIDCERRSCIGDTNGRGSVILIRVVEEVDLLECLASNRAPISLCGKS
jgi:hypothetical protein